MTTLLRVASDHDSPVLYRGGGKLDSTARTSSHREQPLAGMPRVQPSLNRHSTPGLRRRIRIGPQNPSIRSIALESPARLSRSCRARWRRAGTGLGMQLEAVSRYPTRCSSRIMLRPTPHSPRADRSSRRAARPTCLGLHDVTGKRLGIMGTDRKDPRSSRDLPSLLVLSASSIVPSTGGSRACRPSL